MSKSYKNLFEEKSAERKQRQKKFLMIILILFVVASGAWWYFNNSKPVKEQVPQVAKQTVQPTKAAKKEPLPESAKEEKPIEKNQDYTILIDKSDYKIFVLKDNAVVKSWDVAVGAKSGQKQRAGDMTTPTGEFKIDEILDSSYWTYDLGDGKGEIKGVFGPKFISLETGWNGIGIHGTNAPESIGTMSSEGSVCMRNEELLELLNYVKVDTKVTIRE